MSNTENGRRPVTRAISGRGRPTGQPARAPELGPGQPAAFQRPQPAASTTTPLSSGRPLPFAAPSPGLQAYGRRSGSPPASVRGQHGVGQPEHQSGDTDRRRGQPRPPAWHSRNRQEERSRRSQAHSKRRLQAHPYQKGPPPVSFSLYVFQ